MSGRATPPDLGRIRRALAARGDPAFWRSFEEALDEPAFRAAAAEEFPRHAELLRGRTTRRDVMKLAAASLALAGLGACTAEPPEDAVPRVRPARGFVPGRSLHFATASPHAGYATGVVVESRAGRPVKIEGNPDHPASLGATDRFAQAALFDLYDPARGTGILGPGGVRGSRALFELLRRERRRLEGDGGGLRILTGAVGSPVRADLLRRIEEELPDARWHVFEPVDRDRALAGAELAFGRPLETRYLPGEARVVVSLDADLLDGMPGSVRYARELAANRRGDGDLARLYAVASTPTLTSTFADHRVRARPSRLPDLARRLLEAVRGGSAPADPVLAAAAADLREHRGAGLVLAGDGAPAEVHALCHRMNAALGNLGRTVETTAPVLPRPPRGAASLAALVEELEAGAVGLLLVLGGNPVARAPADLDLAAAIARAGASVRVGLRPDETTRACLWHVPSTHWLESWGDERAFDGTVTIRQPLVLPLYGGLDPEELLAVLLGERMATRSLVTARWVEGEPGAPPTDDFRRALRRGLVPGTALAPVAAGLRPEGPAPGAAPAAEGFELVLRPDPTIHDGRYFDNAWLQELPKPLTKLTWENAFLLAPEDAERLGVATGDVVRLTRDGRTVEAPANVLPGQAPGVVTATLGYGRPDALSPRGAAGYDARRLAPRDALHGGPGLEVAATGRFHRLSDTQHHHALEGRDHVKSAPVAEYRRDPHVFGHPHERRSLYPPRRDAEHRWGMTIDLSVCTGCAVCVVACQAENNIPVVGRDQVLMKREMHWLRVDRYWHGDPADPATVFQPVPCQQCEKAPCEVVCPVGATVHSDDGLNDMVYNRCVGTRYCSNNCPYKVRRFNFHAYAELGSDAARLAANPEVTLRERGVMEKCTYCVQRIRAAGHEATREGREIADGEVRTACQQACPTEAIRFGDLADPESAVSRAKAEPRNYVLMPELNTWPRTSYLARLTHPSPEVPE